MIAAPENVTASASCGEMKFSPAATFLTAFSEEPRIVALGDIALRAHLDRAHHEGRIVVHAEHDDFGVRIVLADPPHQLEAGDVGQA